MIQDLKDAFTVTLARRLSSPFLSSFIIAWCFWNYDVVLLVLSGADWDTKVTYINGVFVGWTYACRVTAPIFIAAIYVYAWPWIDMEIYGYSKQRAIDYKNKQMKLEGVTPITPEERIKLEEKYSRSQQSFRNEISEKEDTISELKERISEGANKLREQADEIEKLKLELDDTTIDSMLEETEKTEVTLDDEAASRSEKPDIKTFAFKYRLSDKVKKEVSRKGLSVEDTYLLQFEHGDIDEDVFEAFHDSQYDAHKGKFGNGIPILFVRKEKGVTYKSEWNLNVSPVGLSDVDIINEWYSDYCDELKKHTRTTESLESIMQNVTDANQRKFKVWNASSEEEKLDLCVKTLGSEKFKEILKPQVIKDEESIKKHSKSLVSDLSYIFSSPDFHGSKYGDIFTGLPFGEGVKFYLADKGWLKQ